MTLRLRLQGPPRGSSHTVARRSGTRGPSFLQRDGGRRGWHRRRRLHLPL